MEHSQQLLKYSVLIANPWNAAAGLSRPEPNVTESIPGPRVYKYVSPTARGANTAPDLLGPAVRRRGEALNVQTDCWKPADAWCLGVVWAREPEPDCCGVVTFAYARLCATTPCGTRTRNLRIRSPTPCPLGQGGRCIMYMSFLVHSGERGNHNSQTVGAGGTVRAKTKE